MIEQILQDAQMRMDKSIATLKNELAKIRSGRANPSLLESIKVPYYGTDTPLSQVASITVEDPRTLSVNPWEKNLVPVIEKAILTSDLGLNPATSGSNIRVPLPPLNEERRRELVKITRNEAEGAKVAIRNIRRDANTSFKELLKNKTISEDDLRRAEDRIQKTTDKYIKDVETLLSHKENELMEV
jgi:ribosome recycling factor